MDATQTRLQPPRRGFTLVELLVVIIIISMLAGMMAVALPAALKAAKRMTICSEIQQLSMSLENYKTDCGDYPPDCAYIDYIGSDTACVKARDQARNEVVRHFRKRFPRYRPGANGGTGSTQWDILCDDVRKGPGALELAYLNPSSALAFFLGGLPDGDGKPSGFSANPSNPFAAGGSRTTPFFELDESRYKIDTITKLPQYFPKHIKNPGNSSEGVPYVYFRGRSNAYGPRTFQELHSNNANDRVAVPRYPLIPNANIGICLPYGQTQVLTTSPKDTTNIDWYAGGKIQIIAAGLDGQFGTTSSSFNPTSNPLDAYRYFNPDGNNLDPSEDDNLSSFTPGQLEDGVQ